MYREFITPEDLDVFQRLDTWPETMDDGSRLLTFSYESGEHLTFAYSPLGRSIHLRWTNRTGATVLDAFRESATELIIRADPEKKYIITRFDMGDCSGELRLQTSPAVTIVDRLLF
ncbi:MULTISPECIES: hypothetical protein [unclassified Streptomyces]|uniref:hypothetical protein n=1 Tax=unclassified Streptomyces TaxID=2593676 RepID=UPI002DDAC8EA|nr:hypothetical protein [Streptomyces sp. NBC_01795]WSA96628.1 hypothetical protein OIE63_37540 [Streptomyces sp. NBC_01795]WSS39443.1 hypothetical protein OG220_01630 [Streptomyces sp. NBC_01187]